MIENELKYVLSLDHGLDLRKLGERENIIQGYIDSFRIRQIKDSHDRIQSYELALKNRTSDGRNIEIEDNTINTLFARKLMDVAENKVYKFRYNFKSKEPDEKWCIDSFTFHDDGSVYFVMAEVEMPETRDFPISIPEIISSNLVYAVPRDDNRFSAKKLSNRDYAIKMYQELIKKNHD